jgi:hypothetical protein
MMAEILARKQKKAAAGAQSSHAIPSSGLKTTAVAPTPNPTASVVHVAPVAPPPAPGGGPPPPPPIPPAAPPLPSAAAPMMAPPAAPAPPVTQPPAAPMMAPPAAPPSTALGVGGGNAPAHAHAPAQNPNSQPTGLLREIHLSKVSIVHTRASPCELSFSGRWHWREDFDMPATAVKSLPRRHHYVDGKDNGGGLRGPSWEELKQERQMLAAKGHSNAHPAHPTHSTPAPAPPAFAAHPAQPTQATQPAPPAAPAPMKAPPPAPKKLDPSTRESMAGGHLPARPMFRPPPPPSVDAAKKRPPPPPPPKRRVE